jgi:galactonate dehydratase
MALWDLKGKRLGAAVHQLLGGPVRDRVAVYRNLWGRNPEEFAASAKIALKEGLDTVKVSPAGPTRGIASDSELDTIVEVVKAVKDSIGEMKLAVDLHGRLTPAASRRLLPRLAEFDLLFVEEPCLPEGSAQHLHDLRLLQTEQPLPLATGERLLTRREFADHLFPTPAIAVIQPDLAVVGGISEGVAIGAMAEAAQVALAPHCPYGPIQFAASIQVAAVSPAHFLQEYQSLGGAGAGGGIPGGGQQWEFDLLADTFSINDGHVQIPQGVGLGIEVCEDRISEHEESWNPHPPPLWQHPDGSHAEW